MSGEEACWVESSTGNGPRAQACEAQRAPFPGAGVGAGAGLGAVSLK